MLEKPLLPDERIIEHLWPAYRLEIARVEFLPLGADANTAVYRVEAGEAGSYFLKLRKGNFKETSLLVPQFLSEQGIRQVIPPLRTKYGGLWTRLYGFTCVVYPFVEGRDGFEEPLSEGQWIEFGNTLKRVHSMTLPPDLLAMIPTESYSPRWREMVMDFQKQVEQKTYLDPVAARMAAVMKARRGEIRLLVERAGELASILESQPLERALCHADIHAGNLLLSSKRDWYIVDWDDPILAPKERDLMFIGGGVGGVWDSAREEDLFFQGYGPGEINWIALTYYRYERIVQDIAAFCEEILLTTEGGVDREQGLHYFTSQFSPNSVLEISYRTDKRLKGD